MDLLILIVLATILAFGFVVFWGAPYVPSKKSELDRVFSELYAVGENDVLLDIGSGDGVVLRSAAKHGVGTAVGYELNPVLAVISKILSRRQSNIKVHVANLWNARFPEDTTVVYVFSESRDIGNIAEKVSIEATRLNKTLLLIVYGSQIPGAKPIRSLGAHSLYEISPLQASKA